MTRELILRVTLDECEVQKFRGSGPGGQKKNKTESAIRVIHHPSGARGECSEHREQLQNKRTAFGRMAQTPEFQAWVQEQIGDDPLPESSSTERVRTYNMVDNYVKDHRTGDRSSNIDAILDGDIDSLYD